MATLSISDRNRIAWVISYLRAGGGGKFINSKVAEELGKVFSNTCGFRGCCISTFTEGLKSTPVLTLLQAMLCGEEGLVIPDAAGDVVVDSEVIDEIIVDDEVIVGPSGPTEPALLTACTYGVLAGESITNSGPTVISDDLGLHPGTSVTGAPTVTGDTNINNAAALQAKSDLTAAYLDLAGRTGSVVVGPDISGQTFAPGLYSSATTLDILTSNVTLDGGGNVNSVFIFQVGSGLNVSNGRAIILTNGAQAENVYFQVGSSAVLGTTVSFQGRILALTSISLNTGASIQGAALARNGSVTLLTNSIVSPPC